MQVQLSVFYKGGYISYLIHSDDEIKYDFTVHSKSSADAYAPDHFSALFKNDEWTFTIELLPDFKKSLLKTLKKIKI